MRQQLVQTYQQQAVQTATPAQLLLMLYDGAIRFTKQAIQALQENNIESAHHAILRVQDIVREWMVTLDQSAPIAKQLMPLYDYFLRLLIQANVKKDPTPLKELLGYLEDLHDAWAQAAKKVAGQLADVKGGLE
ncbi:MAG TPA: flagellar export chaperone FliS [Haloplasmataceae bacterium]